MCYEKFSSKIDFSVDDHQWEVIDVAKEKIFDESRSVIQVAYDLRFKYLRVSTLNYTSPTFHPPLPSTLRCPT
jgi:hypothetical protein